MGKKLSEMSLEELWELFPIYLTEHQDCWSEWYEEEQNILKNILPTRLGLQIYHIGSTAIHGIWAKPIVDILIELPDSAALVMAKELLVKNDYICMSESDKRISLNKGYTEKGFAERVFHIHLRLLNDKDEIYFRDYLNEHAKIAEAYEKLKFNLWKRYEHDRDQYTAEKTEFVNKYTSLAKQNLRVQSLSKTNF